MVVGFCLFVCLPCSAWRWYQDFHIPSDVWNEDPLIHGVVLVSVRSAPSLLSWRWELLPHRGEMQLVGSTTHLLWYINDYDTGICCFSSVAFTKCSQSNILVLLLHVIQSLPLCLVSDLWCEQPVWKSEEALTAAWNLCHLFQLASFSTACQFCFWGAERRRESRLTEIWNCSVQSASWKCNLWGHWRLLSMILIWFFACYQLTPAGIYSGERRISLKFYGFFFSHPLT